MSTLDDFSEPSEYILALMAVVMESSLGLLLHAAPKTKQDRIGIRNLFRSMRPPSRSREMESIKKALSHSIVPGNSGCRIRCDEGLSRFSNGILREPVEERNFAKENRAEG
jgi:hypothetical protein